jgi:hypothetical protein
MSGSGKTLNSEKWTFHFCLLNLSAFLPYCDLCEEKEAHHATKRNPTAATSLDGILYFFDPGCLGSRTGGNISRCRICGRFNDRGVGE